VSMVDYLSKARHLIGFRPKDRGADENVATDMRGDGETLPERVIEAAKAAGMRIGTAESCTGGLISAALTSVAGSSEVVWGSVVSYSNDVKTARLGVSPETLEAKGAVSEETACQMADGARAALGVDVAVSVTGIAGPGGAVPGKPVGTVWIGVASDAGTHAALHRFDGDREDVRRAAVDAALGMLLASLAQR
ncbi:MAG: CinA family protein, partial [Slackia sp.]|nr:CinA family protein [Slackia sp.]